MLTVLIAFATLQLLVPGLGKGWFSSDFAPEGWTHAERWQYLGLEGGALLVFVLLGVVFWALGRPTRSRLAVVVPQQSQHGAETVDASKETTA
jgi:hypothetical protein